MRESHLTMLLKFVCMCLVPSNSTPSDNHEKPWLWTQKGPCMRMLTVAPFVGQEVGRNLGLQPQGNAYIKYGECVP